MRRVLGRGADAWEAAQSRLAALRADAVAGVAVPASVEKTAEGDVVAVSARVDGLDLESTVRVTRRLTAGECVWLGRALLAALGALHELGVAHGDVSPRNVVLARRGPVLVDVLGGAVERGTPGFAAPERAASLGPACDVYSVGKLLAAVVRPEDATRVGAWVAPMIAADPQARPDARTASVALESCAPAQPMSAPELDIAAEMRARAVEPDEVETVKDPAARGWRLRRGVARAAARGGVAAGAIALGIVGVAWGSAQAASTAPDPMPSASAPAPVAEAASAAREIVAARYAALETSDAAQLRTTTVEGSAARGADEAEARALERGKVAYDGVEAHVASVTVLEADEAAARVLVTYTVSEHTRWRGSTAKRRPEKRVTEQWLLVADEAGWLLAEVTTGS